MVEDTPNINHLKKGILETGKVISSVEMSYIQYQILLDDLKTIYFHPDNFKLELNIGCEIKQNNYSEQYRFRVGDGEDFYFPYEGERLEGRDMGYEFSTHGINDDEESLERHHMVSLIMSNIRYDRLTEDTIIKINTFLVGLLK